MKRDASPLTSEAKRGGPYRRPEDAPAAEKRPEVLRCDSLTLTYDGIRNSVDGLSFSVARGSVLALVGPNGAGKTSTLRMLAGLQEPTRGRAVVERIDIAKMPEQARRHIGYLPDDFALYDELKAIDQLLFFARLYGIDESSARSRSSVLLREVGLLEHQDRRVGEFSRGMRQRLGVAKTLLHKPSLLLLDEPASALDPASRDRLKGTLRGLKAAGQAIIVSSHILPDLAGLADAVVILERGRAVYVGPLDEAEAASKFGVPYVIQLLAPERADAVFADCVAQGLSVEAGAGGRYEVSAAGGEDAIADLVERLSVAGARVCRVEPKESALEAVYRASSAKETA